MNSLFVNRKFAKILGIIEFLREPRNNSTQYNITIKDQTAVKPLNSSGFQLIHLCIKQNQKDELLILIFEYCRHNHIIYTNNLVVCFICFVYYNST